MSTSALRDAFNAVSLLHGVRCTAARLRYCDKAGGKDGHRDHQIIEFDVVRASDNSSKTIVSGLLPPASDIMGVAQKLAEKA